MTTYQDIDSDDTYYDESIEDGQTENDLMDCLGKEVLFTEYAELLQWNDDQQLWENKHIGIIKIYKFWETDYAAVSFENVTYGVPLLQYIDANDIETPTLSQSESTQTVACIGYNYANNDNNNNNKDDEDPIISKWKLVFYDNEIAAKQFISVYMRYINAYNLYSIDTNNSGIDNAIKCYKLADDNCKSLISGFIRTHVKLHHIPNLVYSKILFNTDYSSKGVFLWYINNKTSDPFQSKVTLGPSFSLPDLGIHCKLTILNQTDLKIDCEDLSSHNDENIAYINCNIECEGSKYAVNFTSNIKDETTKIITKFFDHPYQCPLSIKFTMNSILRIINKPCNVRKHYQLIVYKNALLSNAIIDGRFNGWQLSLNRNAISIGLDTLSNELLNIVCECKDASINKEHIFDNQNGISNQTIPYHITRSKDIDTITINFYITYLQRDFILFVKDKMPQEANGLNEYLECIQTMDLYTPKVLDVFSEILIHCIQYQNHEENNDEWSVCWSFYHVILEHIGNTLGQKTAVDGFLRSWIDHDGDGNLYSFIHLMTEYNALKFIKHLIRLYPEQRKVLVNAFVDIRTTLSGESSLIIAIKNGYQDLILFMLNEIWIVNGSDQKSALIFDRILKSKYDNNGKRILDALDSFNFEWI